MTTIKNMKFLLNNLGGGGLLISSTI